MVRFDPLQKWAPRRRNAAIGGYEARCLGQTWKRMKMEPNWGILEGGEPARRDRGVLVPPSPITKLILVRFPDE